MPPEAKLRMKNIGRWDLCHTYTHTHTHSHNTHTHTHTHSHTHSTHTHTHTHTRTHSHTHTHTHYTHTSERFTPGSSGPNSFGKIKGIGFVNTRTRNWEEGGAIGKNTQSK